MPVRLHIQPQLSQWLNGRGLDPQRRMGVRWWEGTIPFADMSGRRWNVGTLGRSTRLAVATFPRRHSLTFRRANAFYVGRSPVIVSVPRNGERLNVLTCQRANVSTFQRASVSTRQRVRYPESQGEAAEKKSATDYHFDNPKSL